MSKLHIAGLIALLFISALLGSSMLTRGHNWAYSDFSAYIMQAESILNGSVDDFIAHNKITVEASDRPVGPIAYPWGYPLLLTPIVYLAGVSVAGMKLLNVIFYLLFLLCLFFLFRNRLSTPDNFIITSLFAFSPVLLSFQDNILSDISFLLASTAAIFLIDRLNRLDGAEQPCYLERILVGMAILAAFLIRTNGLLLLPTLFACQIFFLLKQRDKSTAIKKNLLPLATPYFVFLGLWIIISLLLPGGQSSHLSHYEDFRIGQLTSNLSYYNNLGSAFFQGIPYAQVIYNICLVFFFLGMILKWRDDLLFILYTLLTILLYLSWPDLQGIRFLFPIFPFFIYFSLQGMKAFLGVLQKISKKDDSASEATQSTKVGAFIYYSFWVYLLVFSLLLSGQGALENLSNDRDIHGPFDEVSIAMFEYVKSNIPEDSTVIFFKPRVMRLMTERDSILILQCDHLHQGDYVVINKKWEDMGQIHPEEIASCDVPLERIYKNRRFNIYQILD
ncbi:MAG: hypothetical protein B6I38_04365 [Anaerolineaceae bacterium 4572_5.1]|nr:MAG: hypothetical protein B6I38_04365 [Anaerolineaceae bacterium 4572_5.1]